MDRPSDHAPDGLTEQRRMLDLALAAAGMGAWRYTIGDNACVFDERAQKLYGLSQARVRRGSSGGAPLLHPDDGAAMWAALARACDPAGEGRYNVEYRTRRPEGGWRWLGVSGVAEFEGDGADRRAVAITGASRDISDAKSAEEHRSLLVNELTHRVKNILATVQSITLQTLRADGDLETARAAVQGRLLSLSRAHDVLTNENWDGADLWQVATRALEPFAAAPEERVRMQGPPVRLSPRQALALSMALHELATNAAKYGALSTDQGRIEVSWEVREGPPRSLSFAWRETGGPPVSAPKRRGFGSRLLESGLARELGGATRIRFDPAGLALDLTAEL